MRLGHLPHVLAAIAVPPACGICAGATGADAFLCQACDRELSSGAPTSLSIPGFETAWAVRPYEGTARDLVAALKFRRLLPAAARAAELIAAEAPPKLVEGPFVPVPADPLRGAWRGFDPAEEIARVLAQRTGHPISACLRRSHGARQVGRTRRQRLLAQPRVDVDGPAPRRATIVDDVTTTGATLAACAAALRTAGCERVDAVVLAAARA